MILKCSWGFAATVLLLMESSAQADFVIDGFENFQRVEVTGPGSSQSTGFIPPPGTPAVLGGARKVIVNRTSSNNGTADVSINGDDPSKLDFATLGTRTTGDATIIYDHSTTFSGAGNVGVNIGTAFNDVTQGGLALGLNINGFADHWGVSMVVTFYDIAGLTKAATINFVADPGATYTNYFTMFTAFTGAADLTHVAAFTAKIIASQGSTNVSLDYIVTAPNPIALRAVPEPASLVLVGLGMFGSGLFAYRRRKMAS